MIKTIRLYLTFVSFKKLLVANTLSGQLGEQLILLTNPCRNKMGCPESMNFEDDPKNMRNSMQY